MQSLCVSVSAPWPGRRSGYLDIRCLDPAACSVSMPDLEASAAGAVSGQPIHAPGPTSSTLKQSRLSRVQMDLGNLGPLSLHQHRHMVKRPWILLRKALKSRTDALRKAAELQACSRRPVIWHSQVNPDPFLAVSCFSSSEQYHLAIRPKTGVASADSRNDCGRLAT